MRLRLRLVEIGITALRGGRTRKTNARPHAGVASGAANRLGGGPARSQAPSARTPLRVARYAQDAVFAGWDTVTAGLALNWT
jgi:hypothetical protein